MDSLPQNNQPNQPTPSVISGKPSFFKRKLFKFVCVPIIVLAIVITIIQLKTGVVGLLGRFSYYYVLEARDAVPTPTVSDILSQHHGISLSHRTSLRDLGVSIPQQAGNGADDYINYFGYDASMPDFRHASGTWDNAYNGIDEGKINLEPQDEQFLLAVASKQNFEFFPDHFPIPKTPVSKAPLPFNPANIMRFTRRMIVFADSYSGSSNSRKTETILQSLLVWGRKMEDAKDANLLEWLVGEKVEDTAVSSLVSFYEKSNDGAKKDIFSAYQKEIADLKQMQEGFSWADLRLMPRCLALAQLNDASLKDRFFVRATMRVASTSEAGFDSALAMFDTTDDPIIQRDGMTSALTILRIKGPEPEHSVALEILQKYTNSENQIVQNWAHYILDTDPKRIIEDTKP